MNSYALILLADVLLTADFALQKQYQRKAGVSARAGLIFNGLLGLFAAVIFFIINGFQLHFSLYSLIMAAAMSVLCMLYVFVGFRILKDGNMALYTLFLMTGGMTIPYLWGTLFLNEEITVLRTLGLVLIIGAIVFSNLGAKRPNKTQLILCICVFFFNGFVSVISKMHQINTVYEPVSAGEFVFWTAVIKFVICSCALLFMKKEPLPSKPTVLLPIIFCSALANGLSYLCQLIGAANLPATLLYPLVTGGCVILSPIMGWLVYKEKLSVYQWAAIGICAVGTCLFL